MKRIQLVRLEMVKEKTIPAEYDVNIGTPDIAKDVIKAFIGTKDREILALVCLNTKNRITCLSTVSMGSLNSSIVHPREVFKIALLANSASIVIGHNHPSGDCTPSREDINITERLVQAGEIIGIELLDHIICNDYSYISLKEKGII